MSNVNASGDGDTYSATVSPASDPTTPRPAGLISRRRYAGPGLRRPRGAPGAYARTDGRGLRALPGAIPPRGRDGGTPARLRLPRDHRPRVGRSCARPAPRPCDGTRAQTARATPGAKGSRWTRLYPAARVERGSRSRQAGETQPRSGATDAGEWTIAVRHRQWAAPVRACTARCAVPRPGSPRRWAPPTRGDLRCPSWRSCCSAS